MIDAVRLLPSDPYEVRRGEIIDISGIVLADQQILALYEASRNNYLIAQICTSINGPKNIAKYYNCVYIGHVDSLKNLKDFILKAQGMLGLGRTCLTVRFWSEFKVIALK